MNHDPISGVRMSRANAPKPETEMLDVVVTLDAAAPGDVRAALPALQRAGLQVVKVDESNGIVEGTLPANRLAELRRVKPARYVRQAFEYIAEKAPPPSS